METSVLNRFYTIAHRYDNIKVVELHFFALGFSCHGTMLSGYSEFPNNHFYDSQIIHPLVGSAHTLRLRLQFVTLNILSLLDGT